VVGALILLGLAAAAPAEEVRQQLNVPMILQMLARPVESPEAALRESVRKDAAPGPARADGGEVMPDGSVRYGRGSLSVIIKNPCPPGDLAHEVGYRPLPGRARR
jgi:hypothetical protein